MVALVLPRSPRESVLRGNEDAARRTVAQMRKWAHTISNLTSRASSYSITDALETDDVLVDRTIAEIREKIAEESSSSYLECFNFKSKLRTGQRTVIGCLVQSFQQVWPIRDTRRL